MNRWRKLRKNLELDTQNKTLMSTLGDTFRDARLKKKIGLSEAATATRIKIQTLEGLETDNYSSIPAPVYGKGFVRMYAEYLELDPRKCVEEYVAQTGGARSVIPQEVVAAQITVLDDEPKESAAPSPESGPTPEPESGSAPRRHLTEEPGPVAGATAMERFVALVAAEPLKAMVAGLGIVVIAVFVVSGVSRCVPHSGRAAGHPAARSGHAGGDLVRVPYEPPDPYLDVAP